MNVPPVKQDKAIQNFYVWLVWGLPAVVVIAGIFTTFIAFHRADDMVYSDYYKTGLAINENKEAEHRAGLLAIAADIHVTESKITLTLTSNAPHPATLHLLLSHPTNENFDQQFLLVKNGSIYSADLNDNLSHSLQSSKINRWYFSLEERDKDNDRAKWRLREDGPLLPRMKWQAKITDVAS